MRLEHTLFTHERRKQMNKKFEFTGETKINKFGKIDPIDKVMFIILNKPLERRVNNND